ncbi:MAG: helix-turn-helix domain-containing protein [Acidobacteriaceae bacterium]
MTKFEKIQKFVTNHEFSSLDECGFAIEKAFKVGVYMSPGASFPVGPTGMQRRDAIQIWYKRADAWIKPAGWVYPTISTKKPVSNHPNRSRAGSAASNPFPADIRSARESAGITQSTAAAMIHASLRGWQKWETGERRMHPAFWELFQIKIRDFE